MHVFEDITTIQTFLKEESLAGKQVGLVPTMGALHTGHLALIEKSIEENDLTICSIYVNPLQFNNSEDLQKYPRTLKSDKEKLNKYQNLHLFLPQDAVLYQENPKIHFNFGSLEESMEGEFRPGHFNGVAIVVSKFFNIVKPQRVYFGQKDLQQCMIIRQLIQDLSFDLEMIIQPTVRESDGLALSSRNRRLSPDERLEAVRIPEALNKAKDLLKDFPEELDQVHKQISAFFAATSLRLEYFSIVNTKDLKEIQKVSEAEEIAICIAAYAGQVRLLDNIILTQEDLLSV